MKTVLITGATGFIGHFLVNEFIKDHNIICLVRPGTKNLIRLTEYLDKIKIVEHNISEPLQANLGRIDIILHAGANPSTADSIEYPIEVIKDNVLGTANLLEFARGNNIERFVYYSSGEVFGPVAIGQDSIETASYNSNSPYAASKAAGEELTVGYAKSFNLSVSIIHINNTFGPKCQRNRLPVIILNSILKGKTLCIHGTEELISGRRWFHAADVAAHTRFVLDNQQTDCEKWNSAGDRFVNNLEFAELFASAINKKLFYKLIPIENSSHKLCFSIDPSKLYKQGYKDQYSLEQRIVQTVEWYRQNPNWL